MKKNNLLNTILLITIGVLVGIALVFATRKNIVDTSSQNSQNDLLTDASGKEIIDELGRFIPDVFIPNGSVVVSDTPIDFNRDGRAEHVIVYEKKQSLDDPVLSGYVVAGNIKDGWNIIGASGKEVSGITIGKFTANSGVPSILVIEKEGEIKEWHVVTWNAGNLSTHSGGEARNGVLNSLGYIFNGRNDVLVSGNTIIENIPGYSLGTPICCPDLQTLSIEYIFTGNAIVVSDFSKGEIATFK